MSISELGAPLEGFPPETFQERRTRVLEALGEDVLVLPGAPVRFSSRDTEYPYRSSSELFYLTGAREPGTVAVLRGHAEEERYVLFVQPRDPKAELWTGPRLGPEAARERYGADAAHPLEELEAKLPGLIAGAGLVHHRLGEDDRVERLVRSALREARARGPRTGSGPRGVMDPGGLLDDLRVHKDGLELERMRRAAAITVDTFREALPAARPGVGEWELQALVDASFRRAGADGPAYLTIVASGSNACVLHYVENSRVVAAGDLVLLDAGAAVSMYASDITRTFPVAGSFTPEQRDVYQVVEAARARAVEAVRPGATVEEVHGAAVGTLTEGLVALGVLSGAAERLMEEKEHEAFYPHRTSHWLGLDVHDVGDYARGGASRALEPGMVLTIEPGLYFAPGHAKTPARFAGIGVRIEDDVLVTAGGREVLTGALPTAPDDIEALVRG